MPSPRDELRLYVLGAGNDSYVAAWAGTGQARGALALALPATLKPGWYELRLETPPDPTTIDLVPIARSEPIRVF